MTWALAVVAVLVMVYAALSRGFETANISGAMFFTTTGLLVGPVLGLIDLHIEREEVKGLAEITLTLVLFADASRISLRALRREYAVPLRLLGVGLPLTIVGGALVAAAVIPGISLAEAAVLAVALACTDAALGQAVVTDERLPSRVRQGLNVESGLNDGLCVPIFFIAIAVAEADAGTTTEHAAATLVFEQIGYGLIGGVVAGVAGALLLRFGAGRGLIGAHWTQILVVATALLAAGVATALGGSIFIAAFVGGLVFGAMRNDTAGDVSRLLDEGGELFNAATFIVFGAIVLGPLFDELSWEIAAYAVLSLTIVRMLPVAIALLGTDARPPTVGYLGWFGPRGLASIVFAVILIDDADLPHEHEILIAIASTIALSIYVHGLTARPLTERYVAWWASHPRTLYRRWKARPRPSIGGASRCEGRRAEPARPAGNKAERQTPPGSAAPSHLEHLRDVRELHARAAVGLAERLLVGVDPLPARVVDVLGSALVDEGLEVVVDRRCGQTTGLEVLEQRVDGLVRILLVRTDDPGGPALDPARRVHARDHGSRRRPRRGRPRCGSSRAPRRTAARGPRCRGSRSSGRRARSR